MGLNILGRIVSNSEGTRQGLYVLNLDGPIPEGVDISTMVSAVNEDGRLRSGWCEGISQGGTAVMVGALNGWFPVNGDVLIAAKLVPAPPPMMAVPS